MPVVVSEPMEKRKGRIIVTETPAEHLYRQTHRGEAPLEGVGYDPARSHELSITVEDPTQPGQFINVTTIHRGRRLTAEQAISLASKTRANVLPGGPYRSTEEAVKAAEKREAFWRETSKSPAERAYDLTQYAQPVEDIRAEERGLEHPSPFLDPVNFLTGLGTGGYAGLRSGSTALGTALNALRTALGFQTLGLSEAPGLARGGVAAARSLLASRKPPMGAPAALEATETAQAIPEAVPPGPFPTKPSSVAAESVQGPPAAAPRSPIEERAEHLAGVRPLGSVQDVPRPTINLANIARMAPWVRRRMYQRLGLDILRPVAIPEAPIGGGIPSGLPPVTVPERIRYQTKLLQYLAGPKGGTVTGPVSEEVMTKWMAQERLQELRAALQDMTAFERQEPTGKLLTEFEPATGMATGKVLHRFGGYRSLFPELEAIRANTKQILNALDTGPRSKLYQNLLEAAKSQVGPYLRRFKGTGKGDPGWEAFQKAVDEVLQMGGPE